jgi:hypothetical protein
MNKHLCTCEALCLSVVSLAWAQPAVLSSPAEALTIPAISVPRDRVEELVKLDVVVTDAAGYGQAVWSNYPVSEMLRPGLRLGSLGQEQKNAVMHLLQTVLSPMGYQKVLDIPDASQLGRHH